MEKFENAALAFSPSPHLDLLTPQRLITSTTMADYMLMFVLQKILSLSGLLGQNILLLCHNAERKRIMDKRHFRLLLAGFGFCLYTARKLYAHAPSLLLRFWLISSATCRPVCRGRRGGEKIVLV